MLQILGKIIIYGIKLIKIGHPFFRYIKDKMMISMHNKTCTSR